MQSETDAKINKIVGFFMNNRNAKYSISFISYESEDALNIPIYSTGEMLNVVTNVNYQTQYPFFDFEQFKGLTVTMQKPLYISIK